MFKEGDIWQHHNMYHQKLSYLLLKNLGTPPHWYCLNLDSGQYTDKFLVKTDTGDFRWKKVA